MDAVLQNLQSFYTQYLQPLIAQLLYISVKFQVVLVKIPVVGSAVRHIPIYPFAIAFYIVLFALIASLVNFLVNFRSNSTRRKVKRFYGISDLSRFKVHLMGKPGSKYYQEEGFNAFQLNLPHWKRADKDGSKKGKFFNRIVHKYSVLWLHAGQKVYVLRTKDPWEMIYLVHMLRESGLDISPCVQELDKQYLLSEKQRNYDSVIRKVISEMCDNRQNFIDLCRQRFKMREYSVSDAPKNDYDIDLFIKKQQKNPNIVRCFLTDKDHITGLEEMKSFKDASESFFADECTLVTTGNISVAAAGFAREHNITIICNEQLVSFLKEDVLITPAKEYLRWELKSDDISRLLPEDLAKIVTKKMK